MQNKIFIYWQNFIFLNIILKYSQYFYYFNIKYSILKNNLLMLIFIYLITN